MIPFSSTPLCCSPTTSSPRAPRTFPARIWSSQSHSLCLARRSALWSCPQSQAVNETREGSRSLAGLGQRQPFLRLPSARDTGALWGFGRPPCCGCRGQPCDRRPGGRAGQEQEGESSPHSLARGRPLLGPLVGNRVSPGEFAAHACPQARCSASHQTVQAECRRRKAAPQEWVFTEPHSFLVCLLSPQAPSCVLCQV